MKRILFFLLLLVNLQLTIKQGRVFLEMGQISAQRQSEETITILEGRTTINQHQEFVYCQYCNKQYSATDISRHELYECPKRITVNTVSRSKVATRSGDDDYRNYYCCLCMRPARCCTCTGPEARSNWVYDPDMAGFIDTPYIPPVDDSGNNGYQNPSTIKCKKDKVKKQNLKNAWKKRGYDRYYNKDCGYCLRAWKRVWQDCGLGEYDGTEKAKDFGPKLIEYGYEVIYSGNSTTCPSNYTPQLGDTRVWDTYPGQSKRAGHIDWWNGTQWVSDFKQRQWCPGYNYKKYRVSYKIYR